MDGGIPMEPVGKYRPDRNGSAKAAAWRNMVDQDLDDVAFLADSEKRGGSRLRDAPVAVCSQRRALCLAALVLGAMFATALLVVYATPQPDCPCLEESLLVPGHPPAGDDSAAANANKERIASSGVVFPWRGARLPTFLIPKHYNLWLHPNLTTGELRGEVSIDFKVDKDALFVVLNARDMNITERALFKSGSGSLGPKIAKTLEYPPADQTYIEFKDKLRRKYNYTLSLRFITKLDRSDKQRGFFMAGTHRQCAVSRFWLTHARSAFPCLDEPHFRATFKLTIVRDRFHVSLTNMPIVATEEAGFYLGHRLLQDEFATSPPMSPHMMAMAVCRLQRRAAPPLPTSLPEEVEESSTTFVEETTTFVEGSTELPDEVLPPPEISLYSDQQVILDESGPLLEWVSKTLQQFAYELNTSYPLPKLDIVVVEGGSPYSEGWGLITLAPATLSDTKTIARLLAQQWFGGLVSPRWWSSQWLLEALTSVLGERAPPLGEVGAERQEDALLLHHMLPALRYVGRLQDEFATSPPMSPHMMAMAVCRLQRRAAPPLPTSLPEEVEESSTTFVEETTTFVEGSTELPDEVLPPPEISLYSDQQVILDESGPLLEWVSKTLQQFAYELNTSYPLPKLDIVVVEGGSPYSEGWGLITLAPATLSDTKTIARLLAQQWFGGLVSPRWWSSQWLLEALTSVLGERAPPLGEVGAERQEDALLLHHMLPALRLDSSNSARAIASPRLDRADIESATDELSLHKGAAIVSMAISASGIEAGRAALSRLLRTHRAASADARDLWRALHRPGRAPPHAWDGWCERPGYPIVTAVSAYPDVVLSQERFVMSAEPPDPEPAMLTDLLTVHLRADLEVLFYEPENFTEPLDDDVNSTTTTPMTTTTRRIVVKTTKAPPQPKWVIPITFTVGPLEEDEDLENITRVWPKNGTENLVHNSTWYDVTNDTKIGNRSRWAENVTHLVWMNDTELVIPELGRHKWVRYNVGARGLYRVAPHHPAANESSEWTARRAAAQYVGAAPAERALLLDDAFVLSRAGRLPASRALAAAAHLSTERHWAPWRVVLTHLSWWRELLRDTAAGPHLQKFLSILHPTVQVYSAREIAGGKLNEDDLWLSGALLSAGVEWENPRVTKQALSLYDAWNKRNQTIPELYQEAAFTAGIRTYGEEAWNKCWRELVQSYAAPRPLYNHKALLVALAAPTDDWLFYRFAWTALSPESKRNREWKMWWQTLGSAACRWRGPDAAWRLLRTLPVQPQPAIRCLYQPGDYYQLKELFSEFRGLQSVLDTVSLNAAWVARAEPDLLRHFTGQRQ